MFQQPSAASDFKAADHVGHLLLIYVRELRQGIVTTYGASDAISCDVVVLTNQRGPRCETGVLFFQKPLIGSLRNSIGKDPVLARLAQGTAKPGQSAPYILNPYSEQDAAYATQWLQSVGGNPFQTAPALQQPATPQAPQAPVAPLPQAVPAAPAVASAPLPQAPGVPAAPPQWAAPAQAPTPAPVPQQPPNAAEAQAAMAALGMTQMPPAPAQ
ncbi:hypothetical protein FXF51_56855 [Nonomuraea sp. PA05]|uniref:hypothetical protein n=1 Tax=Nonomuraea sp. PA05 TaxID=2604466 RepID=UPI0011D3B7C6|nr:hypothetical protein [Nonomuraea sp. PA05]TYB50252.1 hypothetical protein FXF51_56855 [Nonomuraea sp. PA05]